MALGGEIGFDEGGVLQALFERPVWSQETEHFRYNKQGQVIKRWTTKYDVSMGDVLTPLILAGFITLGGMFAHRLGESGLPGPPAGVCNYNWYVGMYGPIIGKMLFTKCVAESGKNGGDGNGRWDTMFK